MMVWNDAGWRKEILKKLLTVSLVFIGGYLYYLANNYNDMRFTHTKPLQFMFSIDKYIHFNRFSAIPYYFWYVFIIMTILIMFLQKDSKYYYKLIFSLFTGIFINCIIYVVFPTYVPRMELTGNDILTVMIRRIYSIDPPYNCFPSMHVLYSFICCWYLAIFRRIGWWFDVLLGLIFILIALSTVFSKQHYTPDILGGIAVGATVCIFFTFTEFGGGKKSLL